VIERRGVGRGRVDLQFEKLPISLAQIAAIRRVMPGFSHARPREIHEQISETGLLEVGEFGYIEARAIEDRALAAGLPAVFTNKTRLETVIIDEDGPNALVTEDDEEHERVVREMVLEGVRVVDIEID
jgi:hypothetical protein